MMSCHNFVLTLFALLVQPILRLYSCLKIRREGSQKASLLHGNKPLDLPLKENDILQTFGGEAPLQAKGTAIFPPSLEPVEPVIS